MQLEASTGHNVEIKKKMSAAEKQPKSIPAQQFICQNNVRIHGLLRQRMQGLKLRTWPVRFVVLSDGYIYSYKDENAAVPTSAYSLLEYSLLKEDAKKPNVWNISSALAPQTDVKFACLSGADRDRWAQAVREEMRTVNDRIETMLMRSSEEHYYEDIDGLQLSPSLKNPKLQNLLHSRPIKVISDSLAAEKKERYQDLDLGPPRKPSLPTVESTTSPLSANVGMSPTHATEVSPNKSAATPPAVPLPPRQPKRALKSVQTPVSSTQSPVPSNLDLRVPEKKFNEAAADSPPVTPSVEVPPPPLTPRRPPSRPQATNQQVSYNNSEFSDSDLDNCNDYENIDFLYHPYAMAPESILKAPESPTTTGSARPPLPPLPNRRGISRLLEASYIRQANPDRKNLNALLISTKEAGAYFVRNSRQGNSKVISMLTKTNIVNEYKVFEEDGEFTLEHESKSPAFDSLESLLRYYSSDSFMVKSEDYLGRGIHDIIDVDIALKANESFT